MRTQKAFPKCTATALALAVCLGLGLNAPAPAQQPGTSATVDTTLSDAQILQIFITSNRGEVVTSKPIVESDANPEVQQFAQRMIDAHTAVIEQADSLARAMGTQPESNLVSSSLTQVAKGVAQSLQDKQGTERGQKYIEAQVVLHGQTLDMLDYVLIPNADSAELKSLMEETRPKVADHLRRAQELHHTMTAQ